MHHSAVLLAAGKSKRFDGVKQLANLGPCTLLEHSFRQLLESTLTDVRIAIAPSHQHIKQAVAIAPDYFFEAQDAGDGVGHTIANVVSALDENSSHVMILLADQVAITTAHIEQVLEHSKANPEHIICCQSAVGISPPVVFPKRFFQALSQLTGDKGAKSVILAHSEQVKAIELDAAQIDIDTQAEFLRWCEDQEGTLNSAQ